MEWTSTAVGHGRRRRLGVDVDGGRGMEDGGDHGVDADGGRAWTAAAARRECRRRTMGVDIDGGSDR